jgi:hypothetical protein
MGSPNTTEPMYVVLLSDTFCIAWKTEILAQISKRKRGLFESREKIEVRMKGRGDLE